MSSESIVDRYHNNNIIITFYYGIYHHSPTPKKHLWSNTHTHTHTHTHVHWCNHGIHWSDRTNSIWFSHIDHIIPYRYHTRKTPIQKLMPWCIDDDLFNLVWFELCNDGIYIYIWMYRDSIYIYILIYILKLLHTTHHQFVNCHPRFAMMKGLSHIGCRPHFFFTRISRRRSTWSLSLREWSIFVSIMKDTGIHSYMWRHNQTHPVRNGSFF